MFLKVIGAAQLLGAMFLLNHRVGYRKKVVDNFLQPRKALRGGSFRVAESFWYDKSSRNRGAKIFLQKRFVSQYQKVRREPVFVSEKH